MRHAYQRALRLSTQQAFVQLLNDEFTVLETLAPWCMRLFLHMVRLTNFETGRGEASFAQLHKLMDRTIQPRSGPRLYVPDEQALKKAVRSFEAGGLLARDKAHSQAEQKLFFVVRPRWASVRPNGKLEPQTRTPVDSRKRQQRQQVREGVQGELEPQTRTPYSTGIQDQIARGELSTDSALQPPEADTPPGPIDLGKGYGQAPQGAAQPASRPTRPPRAPARTVAPRKGYHQAPPGGQDLTPPVDAAQIEAELRQVAARMQVLQGGGVQPLRQDTDSEGREKAPGGP